MWRNNKHVPSSALLKAAQAGVPGILFQVSIGQLFDLQSSDLSGSPFPHQQEGDSWLT